MLTQMQTADETTRNRSIRTSSQNILRGIFNKDKSKKKSSYCYAISFLQLFYRCNSIQNYFEFAKIENSNEKILKNIYNRLFSNQKRKKNKAIYIYDFIYNWNGWLGNQRLPNEQSDSMEFANYLIESLSKNIKEIFLSIFMEKSNENLENPVSSSSFFISLQPEKNSLQYLIDNFVQTISLIYKCPKCLLINVNRNFVQSINKDEIMINKVINFFQNKYQFVGMLTFTGSDQNSHIHSIIRVNDEYYLFDDHDVTFLDLSQSNDPFMKMLLQNISNEMSRKSIMYLYEEITDNVNTNEIINLQPNSSNTDAVPASNIQSNVINSNAANKSNKMHMITSFDTFGFPNLLGKIMINSMEPKILDNNDNNFNRANEYNALKNIIKYTAYILRNFDFIDDKIDDDEIKKKGEEIYKKLMEISIDHLITYEEIGNILSPEIFWYNQKYGNITKPKMNGDHCMTNDLSKCALFKPKSLQKEYYDAIDFATFLKNSLYEIYALNTTKNVFDVLKDDSSSDSDFEFDENTNTFDPKCSNAFKENIKYDEEKLYDEEDDEEDEEEYGISNLRYKYPELFNLKYDFDFFKTQIIIEQLNDDNNFIIMCYDWENRVEINNIVEVISKVRNSTNMKYNQMPDDDKYIETIKTYISRDFLKLYKNNFDKTDTETSFCIQYIMKNRTSSPSCNWVTVLRQKKGLNCDQDFTCIKTLLNKIGWFKHLTCEEQNKYLNENLETYSNRNENHSVFDQKSLICLTSLLLDFPNMSTESYVIFMNSMFGSNSNTPICKRTLQKYIKNNDFPIANLKFEPPDLNNIGIRIARVIYSKIIESLFKNSKAIMGFIDEATVTKCEKRKNGKGYVGMTPSLHFPISNGIFTTISIAIPFYGLIYRFYDTQITDKDYLEFISEVTMFMKKHISIDNEEIIFFNDNNGIHDLQSVTDLCNKLKITILPTIIHSSSLISVIGDFYSFVKLNIIANKKYDSSVNIKSIIKNNWNDLVKNKFDIELINEYYDNWLSNLRKCSDGSKL